MNSFGIATLAASGLAAAFFGLAAPAQAAPSGSGNASDAIAALEDRGHRVEVNQRGSVKSLEESTIVSVRYDDDTNRVHVDVR